MILSTTTSVCGFFNVPVNDCHKTSLHELDKVERHLYEALEEWLGIRVYEPERGEAEDVVWHLRRNSPAKILNVLTIGVSKGTRFSSKTSNGGQEFTLARLVALDSQKRIILNTTTWFAQKERRSSATRTTKSKPQKQLSSRQAFFPDKTIRVAASTSIESEARRRGIHIHHAGCCHGGER